MDKVLEWSLGREEMLQFMKNLLHTPGFTGGMKVHNRIKRSEKFRWTNGDLNLDNYSRRYLHRQKINLDGISRNEKNHKAVIYYHVWLCL